MDEENIKRIKNYLKIKKSIENDKSDEMLDEIYEEVINNKKEKKENKEKRGC